MPNQLRFDGRQTTCDVTHSIVRGEHLAPGSLMRGFVKAMAVFTPLSAGASALLVSVAVGREHPEWSSWFGLAAGVGVLAAVLLGVWVSYMLYAGVLDEHDRPASPQSSDNDAAHRAR